jgi:hypothetical protein
MCRRIVTIVAAVAILPAGWLLSGRAEAGASASAPSKYGKATYAPALPQAGIVRHARHERYPFTEFSSSSATRTRPSR